MSEDLIGEGPQPWRCAMCAFASPSAEDLAAHLRTVHMPLTVSEEAAIRWVCPLTNCKRSKRPLAGSFSLALHLDKHAAEAAQAAVQEQMARRSVVGRLLATRSREDLLALDWTQTNCALAVILGIPSTDVAKLRERLRDEGHPLPMSRRGRRRGVSKALPKYIAAGIGKKPDGVVAQALGLSRTAVYMMRRQHGIPCPADVGCPERRPRKRK